MRDFQLDLNKENNWIVGLSDTPRVISGRIVYMSLFLWAMLLYQFYSASIVGSLLAEKPRFIKNIKDLADSNLEVGIENMPYNHDFFRVNLSRSNKKFYWSYSNIKWVLYAYYSPDDGRS